jgi:hypothetical protein
MEKNAPSEKNKGTTNRTVIIIEVMSLFVSSSDPNMPAAQRKAMTIPDHPNNF